ncbi:MAG: hypothetical protein HUU37_02665 [Bdellovibrionales bacterium]|nr:hypothetical protein [Bdellovibrionales bacterium]
MIHARRIVVFLLISTAAVAGDSARMDSTRHSALASWYEKSGTSEDLLLGMSGMNRAVSREDIVWLRSQPAFQRLRKSMSLTAGAHGLLLKGNGFEYTMRFDPSDPSVVYVNDQRFAGRPFASARVNAEAFQRFFGKNQIIRKSRIHLSALLFEEAHAAGPAVLGLAAMGAVTVYMAGTYGICGLVIKGPDALGCVVAPLYLPIWAIGKVAPIPEEGQNAVKRIWFRAFGKETPPDIQGIRCTFDEKNRDKLVMASLEFDRGRWELFLPDRGGGKELTLTLDEHSGMPSARISFQLDENWNSTDQRVWLGHEKNEERIQKYLGWTWESAVNLQDLCKNTIAWTKFEQALLAKRKVKRIGTGGAFFEDAPGGAAPAR